MTDFDPMLTRRSVFVAAAVSLLQAGTVFAAEDQVVTVHLDPNCGCCSGWVRHLQQAGFRTNILETRDLDMPIGSPGMEGGNPEPYEVILFGPAGRRSYMRFVGEKAVG